MMIVSSDTISLLFPSSSMEIDWMRFRGCLESQFTRRLTVLARSSAENGKSLSCTVKSVCPPAMADAPAFSGCCADVFVACG